MTDSVLRVLCLGLAGVFLVAIGHKVRVLWARQAAEQPLMRLSEFRRRFAAPLLSAAAAAELIVVGLLVARPALGLAATLGLLVPYTWELRHLRNEQPCNCLGNSLGATRARALRRNLVLAAAAIVALVPALLGWATFAPVSQGTVGGALLLLAVALPIEPLLQFVEPATVTQRRGSGARQARKGGSVAT